MLHTNTRTLMIAHKNSLLQQKQKLFSVDSHCKLKNAWNFCCWTSFITTTTTATKKLFLSFLYKFLLVLLIIFFVFSTSENWILKTFTAKYFNRIYYGRVFGRPLHWLFVVSKWNETFNFRFHLNSGREKKIYVNKLEREAEKFFKHKW